MLAQQGTRQQPRVSVVGGEGGRRGLERRKREEVEEEKGLAHLMLLAEAVLSGSSLSTQTQFPFIFLPTMHSCAVHKPGILSVRQSQPTANSCHCLPEHFLSLLQALYTRQEGSAIESMLVETDLHHDGWVRKDP